MATCTVSIAPMATIKSIPNRQHPPPACLDDYILLPISQHHLAPVAYRHKHTQHTRSLRHDQEQALGVRGA